ncbi:hypothetical protein D3C75_691740 [compost metagenome]
MGGGHGGAAHLAVASAGQGGADVHAGSCDGDPSASVAEAGHLVADVACRHCNHLGQPGREVDSFGIGAVIAGGGYHDDALAVCALDLLLHRIAAFCNAEAHIDHMHTVADAPFQRFHDVRYKCGSVGVKGFDRVQPGFGGNTDYAEAVVQGACGAGNMSAMPVFIRIGCSGNGIKPSPDPQVGMIADARVNDADLHPAPLVGAPNVWGADTLYSPGNDLGGIDRGAGCGNPHLAQGFPAVHLHLGVMLHPFDHTVCRQSLQARLGREAAYHGMGAGHLFHRLDAQCLKLGQAMMVAVAVSQHHHFANMTGAFFAASDAAFALRQHDAGQNLPHAAHIHNHLPYVPDAFYGGEGRLAWANITLSGIQSELVFFRYRRE